MRRVIKITTTLALALGCVTTTDAATIRGTVIAEDGTPARGARVWAVNAWGTDRKPRELATDEAGRFALEVTPGNWNVQASWGDQGRTDWQYIQVQESDPDPIRIPLKTMGRLRIRLVEAETGRPIVGGRIFLDNGLDPLTDGDGRIDVVGLSRSQYHEAAVVASGRERKRVLFEMAEGALTTLEVMVARGGKVVGRVLDTTGRPVAGATVSRVSNWGGVVGANLPVPVDAQGRFEFDGLPVDQTNSLVASAPEYISDFQNNLRPAPDGTPATAEFQITPQRQQQQLGFQPAQVAQQVKLRTVEGLVVDLHRQPVAATVRWTPQVEARTDGKGKFRLQGVPDQMGTLYIIPECADLAPEVAEIEPGELPDILVVLPPGRAASGVVRDDRGTPFAGVSVLPMVTSVGLNLTERTVKTDQQGRFTVTGLPGTPAITLNFSGDALVNLNHEVEPGVETAVTMSAFGVIAGKVIDAAGQPVRNFRVLINMSHERKPNEQSNNYAGWFGSVGLTFGSEDGSFLVRTFAPQSVQRVAVFAPGYGEATIDRVVATPSNQLNPAAIPTFQLKPAHTLRVHALAAGSKAPVPAARVTLLYEAGQNGGEFQWNPQGFGWLDSVHARTDAAGVAKFAPLTYAEATVLIEAPGFARQHHQWRDGATDLDVPLAPEAVVAGAIIDEATGQALDGIFVLLTSPENNQLDVTPKFGDGGRFRFGELPAGTYTLQVQTAFGELYQEQVVLKTGEHVERIIKLAIPKPFRANDPNAGNGDFSLRTSRYPSPAVTVQSPPVQPLSVLEAGDRTRRSQ